MSAAQRQTSVTNIVQHRARLALHAVIVIALVYLAGNPSTLHAASTMPMHFSHVSRDDGLSQNNVQAILQDSVGYMWFATESGLNRYDGYDIKIYARQRGNPNGLANDFIWAIEEDSEQNLWLATQGGGLVRWNRENDSFTSFRHDPNNPYSLASDDIRTLTLNKDGTIWVGTRDRGVDLLDPRTGHAQHFQHNPDDERSLSNNMVYALHVDALGHLWVGTDGGVNRLNAGTNAFVHYQKNAADKESLSSNMVRTLFEDGSGVLWVGTFGGGLNRFDRATATFSHYRNDPTDSGSLSDDHVRVIFEDDAYRLWIGTADGLNLFDRATGTFDRYRHTPADPQSLQDSYVNSMYQDRSGLLWVGTRSAGVSKWNPRSWSLGHYIKPWLSDTDISSFASNDDGTVWVGTVGAGLAKIDESNDTVERYLNAADDDNSISDDRIMSLLIDRDDMLWIGTMTGGLNRLDQQTGQFQNYRHDDNNPASLSADGVMAIFEDREGQLWVGTYGGGVSVLDQENGSFTHFAHDPDDSTSLSDQRASAILQDGNGAIWIGTFGGGLNLFDAATGSFQRFQNDPSDPSSLADDAIYALHLDNDGNIWVGTAGGGLDLVVKPASGSGEVTFKNYSQRDGLPNNVINGIQSDSSGRLWLSSNNGLVRFDIGSEIIRTFHRGDGLQGEEFNYAAHHRAADGKLYFGGANGFNAFDPHKVEESDHSPVIVLTSFQKFNQPVVTDVPYDQITQFDLDYKDDVVNFTFAALDFTAPQQNTYAYMLDGFDKDWVDLGTMHHLTYTNLDAGNYVLRVNALTGDGISASNGLAIPVNVTPAPWATSSAYLLYACTALVLLCLLWRLQRVKFKREAEYSRRLELDVALRTEQLEERNEELRVASAAKSNFLARMSHEIRTPMNGILGMTHLLEMTSLNDKQDRFVQTVKRSADSLLNIINDVLDFSKIEAGRLELDEVEFDVSDLVDETVELFSGAAAERGLELMCSTPPGKRIAAIGDPLRLKQILINLLSNAVKFTEQGEVVMRYVLVSDDSENLHLRFEVKDTGVGIQQDNLSLIFDSFSQEDGSTSRRFGGTGLGLSICKQLTEMMGGEIGVDSTSGKGSCFWFTLTLQKAGPGWLSRVVSHRLSNLRVMVVDNNDTNSAIMAGYMSAMGIKVVLETSGRGALSRLRITDPATSFDLVMLDTNVGDMDGLRAAKEIRAVTKNQRMKIVLLNPASTDLDRERCRDVGVDDCLPKPIRQSMLYECLLALTASTGSFASRRASRMPPADQLEPLTGRVLLVEDNEVNQAVALGMLEEIGCETVAVANGQEAVERCSNEQFDVVLMDCEMPVMDGFEATAAIRKRQSGGHTVPIIAVTANAVNGDRERCLAAGMQDYISKPIAPKKLHETLKKWLRKSEPSSITKGDPKSLDAASLDSISKLRGVGGEKMVQQVVKLYLSSSAKLVEELRMRLADGDPEAVRQAAHALKSCSQTVGASAIATLSQQIEEMGRNGELAEIDRYRNDLAELYPKTVLALQAAIERAA